MTKTPHMPLSRTKGFTILELLIATVVFSVVLLLVTSGIMQITRVYYKGVTESNTQNTARAIIDTVSQAIQFSGGDVTPTAASPVADTDYAFCVGNEQFSYRLGWQVENSHTPADKQTWHGMVQRTISGGGSDCASSTGAQSLTSQTVVGRDLIGQHMRLSNLRVVSLGNNLYEVRVRVVYGDSDLLYSPSAPTDSAGATRPDAVCRGQQAGSQFCSVAELSTVVVKRVQ